jgi:hypothetical protein
MRGFLIILTLFVATCSREAAGPVPEGNAANATTTSAAKPGDGCLLGTKLDSEGHVAESKSSFVSGEPIWITLRPAQATPKVQVRVEILAPSGEEVKSLFKDVDQEKVLSFPIRNLEAGSYRALGVWGNDALCQIRFEIR